MTSYTGTPVRHQVFNELDRLGLLLGLARLENEANPAYKQRLMDVMVHRANSTYLGLIHGVTRELGLSIQDALRIIPIKDGDGAFLVPVPAVVFKETKCYLYSDYSEGTLITTLDRYDTEGDSWTLGDLRDQINATGYFTATILNNLDVTTRAMCIFNQSSYEIVSSEDISGSGVVIKLENRNIVENSLVISSPNLVTKVASQVAITKRGDFYVDNTNGIIYSYTAPATGDVVRYEYISDNFVAQMSPVIIHSLQSNDFKTKMFEQLVDGDGNTINGLPTRLGADIINELLSVYPTSWGS